MYRSRVDVEPMVGLGERLWVPGGEAGVCAPPEWAAVDGCDALVTTSVAPEGVSR